MTATAPSAVVNAFNARIAAADVAGLTALLTSDHVFVDAFGTRLEGKDAVSAAWKSFFQLFPGYWNEVDSILESGQTIIIAGRGHCRDARLDGPALWRALVRDGDVRNHVGSRGWTTALAAWMCVPLAHLVKHVLGRSDTLHPNTYTSILLLATFTFVEAQQ